MKLTEYKKVADDASVKSSDLNRQLAFAGIAICWIFTKNGDNPIMVFPLIVKSLTFFSLSLFFDIAQYLVKYEIWKRFWKKREHLDGGMEKDYKAPGYLSKIITGFYYIKVLLCLTGYLILIIFLIRNIL